MIILLLQLTWGDFVLAGMLDYLKVMMRMPDLELKYPAVKKVFDNVYTIPQIKAYAEAAVPSPFWDDKEWKKFLV